jgi:hypothetical protein
VKTGSMDTMMMEMDLLMKIILELMESIIMNHIQIAMKMESILKENHL